MQVIERALQVYDVAISFNGGKDCTVLLWLMKIAQLKLGKQERTRAMYVRASLSFAEVDQFTTRMADAYYHFGFYH